MPDYEVKKIEPIVAGKDVQVRVFTLARGDVIPWHYHRESTDHYFVLQGTLIIETREPDDRIVLAVGERHKIFPGTAHCISNEFGMRMAVRARAGGGEARLAEGGLIQRQLLHAL